MNNASQIPQLMERLVQVMTDKGLSAPKYLSPGLSRQEILDLTRGIIEMPEDVIAFYEFTNGTMIPEGVQLHMGDVGVLYLYAVLSLQEALAQHKHFVKRADDNELLLDWSQHAGVDLHGWLPILGEGINYIMIDINRSFRDEPCIFDIDKLCDPELSYLNLQSMLRAIIACYEQGAYLVADGVIVKYDADKISQIERLYNPGIEE